MVDVIGNVDLNAALANADRENRIKTIMMLKRVESATVPPKTLFYRKGDIRVFARDADEAFGFAFRKLFQLLKPERYKKIINEWKKEKKKDKQKQIVILEDTVVVDGYRSRGEFIHDFNDLIGIVKGGDLYNNLFDPIYNQDPDIFYGWVRESDKHDKERKG